MECPTNDLTLGDHRAPYFAMFLVYVVAFLAGLLVRDVSVKRSDISNRMHISSTLKAMKSHGLILSLLLISGRVGWRGAMDSVTAAI